MVQNALAIGAGAIVSILQSSDKAIEPTRMRILFVHQNFPAQFGHIAKYLIQRHGYECAFLSQTTEGNVAGIEKIRYSVKGGSRADAHHCSRTFENQIWQTHAVLEAMQSRPDYSPDLVVSHSGFASPLFLRELYDCPVISYFEFFYRTTNSDMDFRSDLPQCSEMDRLRARARNAMILLDLDNCDAGYSPTQWQRSQLPQVYHDKIQTIFDGVDTQLWRRQDEGPRRAAGWVIPTDKKVITYVSRGMESIRGFDIFMKAAKRLCEQRDDVVFLVVGEDRVAYGADERFTGNKTFKQWVLSQEEYDLTRILFTGRVSSPDLVRILSFSNLHIYLTAPFVLSWSLMNALACECTVLASATPPVQEMIEHEQNGLLCDFFDVDGFVAEANRVLDEPEAFRHLGRRGGEMIQERYSLEVCLPKLLSLYESVAS